MQFWDFLHKNGIPNRKTFVSHRLQIRFFDKGKIFKYTSLSIVFRDGSRTDTKSKMERFALIITDWKPLTIFEKNLYINVYIVSIYINVELLSNVNKRNTLM